jgi:hypothetical protein
MNILPSLLKGKLIIACSPNAAADQLSQLLAELSLRGEITVVDGGHRLRPYRIAHLLAQRTRDIHAASSRFHIRLASTCYQMQAVLRGTPDLPQPYILLDLLATFYDDHVRDSEASRLLTSCLDEINRLRRAAPVLITLAPPLVEQRAFLVQRVKDLADELFESEHSAPAPVQPALF